MVVARSKVAGRALTDRHLGTGTDTITFVELLCTRIGKRKHSQTPDRRPITGMLYVAYINGLTF